MFVDFARLKTAARNAFTAARTGLKALPARPVPLWRAAVGSAAGLALGITLGHFAL
jgi:hypothetical protein